MTRKPIIQSAFDPTKLLDDEYRMVFLLAIIVIISGLIIGAVYTELLTFGVLVLAIFFGSYYNRVTEEYIDREPIEAGIIGLIGGSILSLFVVTGMIALWSGVQARIVIWSVSLAIISGIFIIGLGMLLGFISASVVVVLNLRPQESTKAGLILFGGVGLFGIWLIEQVIDPTGTLFLSNILLWEPLDLFRIANVLQLFAGILMLIGFVTLLDNPSVRQISLVIIILLSLSVGGIGLAFVHGDISQQQILEELPEDIHVQITNGEYTKDSLILTVTVYNPTPYTVEEAGGAISILDEENRAIVRTSATDIEAESRLIKQRENREFTISIMVTQAQQDAIEDAINSEKVTVGGHMQFYVVNTTPFSRSTDDFVVAIDQKEFEQIIS